MTQSTNYSTPPEVISTKDALYLTDIVSWNVVAMKKAHDYATQVQDSEISQILERAGRMHKQHCDKLLSHLTKHSNVQS